MACARSHPKPVRPVPHVSSSAAAAAAGVPFVTDRRTNTEERETRRPKPAQVLTKPLFFWLPSFGYRVFQCVFHEKRKKTRICGDWPIACLPPFLEAVDHNWRVAVTHTHTHRHTRYANEAPVCKCDRDLPRPARARHLPTCSFFFSFFCHRSIENSVINEKLGN